MWHPNVNQLFNIVLDGHFVGVYQGQSTAALLVAASQLVFCPWQDSPPHKIRCGVDVCIVCRG